LVDIIGTVIHLIIAGIIGGIFVWLAAKALGAPRATYWHGILTVISAIIITDIINYFIGGWGWLTIIIEVVVVLLLIKHFFGVAWLKAVVIAVLAVIIAFIIAAVLAMIGLAVGAAAIKGIVPGY
jgi:hypothetical protein